MSSDDDDKSSSSESNIDQKLEAALGATVNPDDDEDDSDEEPNADAAGDPPFVIKQHAIAVDEELMSSTEIEVEESDSESETEEAPKKRSSKSKNKKSKKSKGKSTLASKESAKAAPKKREKRILWARIKYETVNEDGTSKWAYPFLETPMYYLDEYAAQIISTRAPHLAEYGKVEKEWEVAVEECKKQENPLTKEPLFPTLTVAKLRKRFDDWMDFVKWFQAKQERDTGTDDEIANNSLLDLIEVMYTDRQAMIARTSAKKGAEAKKVQNDKAAAEFLKHKAAGKPVPHDVVAVLENTSIKDSSESSSSGKDSSGRKRRPSTVLALTVSTKKAKQEAIADSIAGLGMQASAKAEARLLAQKNRAEELSIRRMEAEAAVERRKKKLEMDMAKEQGALQLQQTMQSFLLDMMKKKEDGGKHEGEPKQN